ncbi:exonuclease domain-containing protein [Arcanobacterium bovis]|uniref:DNA polymerase III subunit epsilon n=1 Tax=Arcanobacterium bovis TaxID=2529275 RepID=A0A4Q9UZH8_9ACTO|nr:exonuclease domain-containing protein [Arcanobacterium bovis]TBW21429.1 DNA polymerase III subunit epsilon [Arcanobacterium bovis]
MQPFVALDFETANSNRASACSVGLVRFDDAGAPADSFYTLIRPHDSMSEFHWGNVRIHGIEAHHVANSPEWGDLFAQISDFVADLPLVAHNMAFDGYVLSDLNHLYGFAPLENPRSCTLRLSRALLTHELPKKNLDAVFQHYFPDEQFLHHRAIDDAYAAGKIFAQFQREYGYDHLCAVCPPIVGYSDAARQRGRSRTVGTSGSRRQGAGGASMTPDQREAFKRACIGSGILAGERVCVTGTVPGFSRAEFKAIVQAAGASVAGSVGPSTTIVVVGGDDAVPLRERPNPSSKLREALRFESLGIPIKILTAREFFGLFG